MADPVVDDVKATAAKAENFVVKFVKDVWAKIEGVDFSLNAWISKVTNGNTTLAVIAAGIVYWLVKPFVSLIWTLPATVTKVILDGLAVAVPAVVGAVPTIVGIALGLLAIVELKNLLKKIFK